MSNTREHGKLVVLRQSKCLCHPWEVVCQREMTSLDTLGLALRSGCERKCGRRVWADQYAGQFCLALLLWLQDILAVSCTSSNCSVVLELESRHLGLELQSVCDVLADLVGDGPCLLCGLVDDNEGAGLGDFKVDALAVRRVSMALLELIHANWSARRTRGPALRRSRLPPARP